MHPATVLVLALALTTPTKAQEPQHPPHLPPDYLVHSLQSEEHLVTWGRFMWDDQEWIAEIFRRDLWPTLLRRVYRLGTPAHCDEGPHNLININCKEPMVANELIVKLGSVKFLSFRSQLSEVLPKWQIVQRLDDEQAFDDLPASDPILLRRTSAGPEDLLTAISDAARRLQERFGVGPESGLHWIEANYLAKGLGTGNRLQPNDLYYDLQWGPKRVGAEEAWNKSQGSSEILVAVVDSGVYSGNRDFADNLWSKQQGSSTIYGRCFGPIPGYCRSKWDTDDPTGHGTLVAGVIGAQGNNDIGIAGIAWELKMWTARFLGPTNMGAVEDGADAIRWAVRMNPTVINASWGSPCGYWTLSDAIGKARDHKVAGEPQPILVVTGSGNDGLNLDSRCPFYPASLGSKNLKPEFWNLVVVGGITCNDLKASGSGVGLGTVDLGAPGVKIRSLARTEKSTAEDSGTSLAAAFVTGAVVLMKAAHPNASPTMIKECLLTDRHPVRGLKNYWPKGRVLDLPAAIDCLGQSSAGPTTTFHTTSARSSSSGKSSSSR